MSEPREIDILSAPECEAAIIGLCVLHPGEVLPKVAADLPPNAFTVPAHVILWSHICAMLADPECGIDHLMLTRRLHDSGDLEKIGGPTVMPGILANAGIRAMLDQYLATVLDKAARRQVLAVAERARRNALDPGVKFADVVGEAQSDLLDVTGASQARGVKTGKEVASEAIEFINTCHKRRGKTTGGPSMGFKELDHVCQGFHPSCLYLLAGRPAMGKTALAMNFVEHLVGAGVPTLVFSLEMSATDLGVRWILGGSRIDIQKARTGMLGRSEMHAAMATGSAMAGSPLLVYDQPGVTVADIAGRVRMHCQRHRIQVVVVDYVQLVKGVSKRGRDNRYLEVAEVAQGLKNLAMEQKISVVATAQLGRGPEERRDKRPMLSDLRESGDLEQAADVVMAVYRPSYYDQTQPENMAKVCVLKNRHGPPNSDGIELEWSGNLVRFSDPKGGERMYS